MQFLFIGDVMGTAGQHMVAEYLPKLKKKYHPQLTIVNGENATRGRGINEKVYKKLLAAGADVITMGNHTWDNPQIQDFIDHADKLIRPANFAPSVPGKGYCTVKVNQHKVGIINLQGRVFMNPCDDPFATAHRIIGRLKKHEHVDAIFVDFHAETTSEKEAFAWYFDGQVTAVVGTHTHVQTNDARVLPRGTAFMSDAGMTGPYDGILGMERTAVIDRFLTQMPVRFTVAEEDHTMLCGCVVETKDADPFVARRIIPVQISPDQPFFE